MFPSLKAVRDSLETDYFNNQKNIESKALDLYKSDKNAAIKYLNDYSNTKAQEMLDRWKTLAVYLIVKYNDMTIKPEENGTFKRTKTGIGASVERPGYPESYARQFVKMTGDKYKVPE